MTWQFRTPTTSGFLNQTSQNVTTPTSTGANEVLVVAFRFNANPGTMSVPSGFDPIDDATNPFKAYRKISDGGEGGSLAFSWTNSVTGVWGCIAAREDGGGVPVLDAANADGGTNGDTNHVAPSVDATYANSLVVGLFGGTGAGSSVSWTPPSGMDERVDAQQGSTSTLLIATETQASAGATGTKTATSSNGLNGPRRALAVFAVPPPATGSKNLPLLGVG